MQTLFKQIFYLMPLIFVSGCVSLLPEQAPQPKFIQLEAGSMPIQGKASHVIVIEQPTMPLVFNSTKIVLKKKGDTGLTYYTTVNEHAWTERLPVMLQHIMIESMRGEGGPIIVGSSGGLTPTYRVRLAFSQFNIIDPGQVEVSLYVTLVEEDTHKVVATRQFNKVVSSQPTVSSYVAAFNGAMGQIIADMSGWLGRNAK